MKITAESGIAAGVRRIEAVTGEGAFQQVRAADTLLDELSRVLKSNPTDLVERVASLVGENKQLNKELGEASQKLAASQSSDLSQAAIDIDGVKFLAAQVQGDNKAMMQTLDSLRSQLGDAVIVLAHVQNDKVGMVIAVSKDLVSRIKAPDIMAVAGPCVGAKGGGRPDLARAGGGSNPAGLDEAFSAAQSFARQQLS